MRTRGYISLIFGSLLLQGCTGILDCVYDLPENPEMTPVKGQLYVDASDWGQWYYIDLKAVAAAVEADPEFNTGSAWIASSIPTEPATGSGGRDGIYTYWYDVFGAGISVNEFRSFQPTTSQPEPENWTFAVHRNNVRTHGCSVAATSYTDIDAVPAASVIAPTLDFKPDRWSENEVWCIQSRMLLGLIGNQGIEINPVLSSWLKIEIPPMPPAFEMRDKVFILKMPDATYAALQLVNYQSPTGVKCCLTIKYRYPL